MTQPLALSISDGRNDLDLPQINLPVGSHLLQYPRAHGAGIRLAGEHAQHCGIMCSCKRQVGQIIRPNAMFLQPQACCQPTAQRQRVDGQKALSLEPIKVRCTGLPCPSENYAAVERRIVIIQTLDHGSNRTDAIAFSQNHMHDRIHNDKIHLACSDLRFDLIKGQWDNPELIVR